MNSFNMKHYREQLGITQRELAKSLCVSYHTVVKWENGSPVPPCCQKLFSLIYGVSFKIQGERAPIDNTMDLPFE